MLFVFVRVLSENNDFTVIILSLSIDIAHLFQCFEEYNIILSSRLICSWYGSYPLGYPNFAYVVLLLLKFDRRFQQMLKRIFVLIIKVLETFWRILRLTQCLNKQWNHVYNVPLEAFCIDIDFNEQLSGQDKNTQNSSMTTTPLSSRKSKSDPVPVPVNGTEISHHSMRISGPRHYSSEGDLFLPFSSVQCFDCICFCALLRNLLFDSEPPPPGVSHESNGYETHLNVTNYDYSRRVFGATLDSISRSRSGRYNTSNRHYWCLSCHLVEKNSFSCKVKVWYIVMVQVR